MHNLAYKVWLIGSKYKEMWLKTFAQYTGVCAIGFDFKQLKTMLGFSFVVVT